MSSAAAHDEDVFQGDDTPGRWLNDRQHTKAMIKRCEREIASYREMKQEEEKDGISNGRRKWLNREIARKEEKLKELKEEDA